MHPPGGLRRVLAGRDFRRLYATRLTGQLADGVFQVGLAGYVLFNPETHATPEKAAGALAVLLLPYSVVGPFAGVFIDRWSRQRILREANLLRAAMSVLVAVLAAIGTEGVGFYVATLSVLSVNRFILASLSAALPHVLEEDLLVTGNSLSTTSGTVAAMLGVGVGYVVRAAFLDHAAPAMLTGAAIYLLASLAAWRIPPNLLGPDHDPARPETVEALRHVATGVLDGAKHVWSHRPAGHALAAIAVHRFCYGLSTIAALLLYRNHFEDNGWLRADLAGLGQVAVASGVGVLAAALITPAATRRFGIERWIVGCLVGASVIGLVCGLPYNQLAFLVGALLLGLVSQAVKICVDTLVQRSIDDDYRGRVFSFYDIVFNIAFVGAAATGALALPDSGRSYVVLVVIAAGYGLTALAYGLGAQRLSRAAPPPVHR